MAQRIGTSEMKGTDEMPVILNEAEVMVFLHRFDEIETILTEMSWRQGGKGKDQFKCRNQIREKIDRMRTLIILKKDISKKPTTCEKCQIPKSVCKCVRPVYSYQT